MNIHSIDLTHNPFEPACMQLVDLNSIVSITPISVYNYTGFNIGISHADFHIYINMGYPILVRFNSGTCLEFPKCRLKQVTAEHEKLIDAWKNKDKSIFPKIEEILLSCQINTRPEDAFQRGQLVGFQECYEYIIRNTGKGL